ncbi:DNA gyrase inhibitor YacG [Acetobacter suratthaniensis]|uniref:DNA gyrase inhibitor YacG n=1 Tax=Acetobacter suratthaniensis TaxID=1502841 RepID=A0ABS3LL66_9PROT|nr:DNA gyrase inhibitor YacG [Acetobacter suratthaniensis]MBO1327913.1 DNA gyrase inhibitor YacG [Acetobacter suratthaniensis]MCX2565907.1 DNA gyrase inhibitor YacG [Acetobacter suratthaniensis]
MTDTARTAKLPPCPICGQPAAQATRPFCSRRCADVDLGRWFSGAYRIPGQPTAEDEKDDSPEINQER